MVRLVPSLRTGVTGFDSLGFKEINPLANKLGNLLSIIGTFIWLIGVGLFRDWKGFSALAGKS